MHVFCMTPSHHFRDILTPSTLKHCFSSLRFAGIYLTLPKSHCSRRGVGFEWVITTFSLNFQLSNVGFAEEILVDLITAWSFNLPLPNLTFFMKRLHRDAVFSSLWTLFILARCLNFHLLHPKEFVGEVFWFVWMRLFNPRCHVVLEKQAFS